MTYRDLLLGMLKTDPDTWWGTAELCNTVGWRDTASASSTLLRMAKAGLVETMREPGSRRRLWRSTR